MPARRAPGAAAPSPKPEGIFAQTLSEAMFMWQEWLPYLQQRFLTGHFQLPVAFDLGATFIFAVTGALAAIRRGYDVVGLFAIALVTGVGGALIRDGIFIQQGPSVLTTDGRYVLAVFLACLCGMLLGGLLERWPRLIAVLDAIGLGAYGAVGMEKSIVAGLSLPAALLVGVINACGGGLLRDVLSRSEPLLFKPGQFYALAALAGCLVFILCYHVGGQSSALSGLCAVVVTFLFRVLAIKFNWQSGAVKPLELPDLTLISPETPPPHRPSDDATPKPN